MTLQFERGQAFRALHDRERIFVIPNPWDAGSTRILASLGFQALATTSAGLAFSLGRRDGEGAVSRDEALANAGQIVAATSLPVAADLENGFGDSPEACAETIRLAAEVGLVGGSIEDATGRPDEPIYPFELAVERVRAASEAARSLPVPFVLTARSENHLHGISDLDDTTRRLVAFAKAGADVLFAPGLPAREDIESVVRAVAPKPVNVLPSAGLGLALAELGSLGVRRVSVGSTLARVAYGSFARAARALEETGSFDFATEAISFGDISAMFGSIVVRNDGGA